MFSRNKTYQLFISHCWDYKDKYHTVVKWINESNIQWKNMSVPNHDPCYKYKLLLRNH